MNTGILNRTMAAKRVGMYVRTRRRSLGLSRAQLAQRLGFVLGSVITHVERGDARIAPEAMANWAAALELDPAQFAKELAVLGKVDPAADTAGSSLPRPAWTYPPGTRV